jgi:hypothetical protein
MKFTLVLSALLATASASSLPQRRGNQLQSLPEIDLANIPERLYGASVPADESLEGRDLEERAKVCPKGYPFLCNGRCCKYNICCKKQCCLPSTDFCGADGYCYRWT